MRKKRRVITESEVLICDACGREIPMDHNEVEYAESLSISYRAGYGSILGDGNLVEADLCQHCIKEILGFCLRVTDDDPFNPRFHLDLPARKSHQPYQSAPSAPTSESESCDE